MKLKVEDVKSSYLRVTMRSVGTDVVYECGIRDVQGVAIGKVVVSWRNRSLVKYDKHVLTELEETGAINSLSVAPADISNTITEKNAGK